MAPKPQNCSTCLFWVSGICKRYPAQWVLVSGYPGNYGWRQPDTAKDDWCGEWKDNGK